MRCEDVIRELAAPGEGRDAAALAEHLDNCPACAEWSARMTSWDRLWERTRPVEPAPERWDSVWHRVEAEFARGQNAAASTPPLHSPHAAIRIAPESISDRWERDRPSIDVQSETASGHDDNFRVWSGSRREYALIAMAAAIMLMMAGLSAFSSRPRAKTSVRLDGPIAEVTLPGGPAASPIVPPAIDSIDIEEGELVVIRSAEERSEETRPEIVRYEPDDAMDWFVMFNEIESMRNTIVAGR